MDGGFHPLTLQVRRLRVALSVGVVVLSDLLYDIYARH